MKSDSWFCCYPADLIADTQHLGNHDFGAYWRMLCFYYLHGPLPNDDDSLRRIAQCEPQDWARCKGVILRFFQLGEDALWHSKRADKEIAERAKRDDRRRAQTEAARASLRAHNSVTRSVTESVTEPVTAVQPQPQPQPHIQPQPQLQLLAGRDGSRPGRECDAAWIAALSESEAYKHINVEQELARMQLWCETHRKQPTRKRFLAWLNRVETPITTRPQQRRYVPNI